MQVARPAFRYYGGKWKLAPWIISHFPKHYHYVEPCGGAASVLLRKQSSAIETYNDINGDVVNFFRVLRTRTEELTFAIQWTPWSREEFELSRECEGDELERARRFWVYQSMGVDAAPGKGSKTGFRIDKARADVAALIDRSSIVRALFAAAERMLSVQIEHRPMVEVIERFDSERTLFYIDPPYIGETRSHAVAMYGQEWTDSDHAAMLAALCSMRGMCVLSGYQHAIYEPLEQSGWVRYDREAQNNSGDSRIESLWLCPRTAKQSAGSLF